MSHIVLHKGLFKRIPSLKPALVFLGVFTIVRLLVLLNLYQQGFLNVSADEFARGIRAAQWARQPNFDWQADISGVWLPFEKYLNGAALLIWPDVIWAPRLTVFLASTVLVTAVFLLTYVLFEDIPTAFLAVLLSALHPWFVWLSGTPMLEMYYLPLFFAGLGFLIIWLRERRHGYWFLSGLFLLVATGFHVQSWTFVNLVFLLTLPYFFQFIQARQWRLVMALIGVYVLGNGLIFIFSILEYQTSGQLFSFLSKHTSYSRWFYSGYDVSVWEKLFYYPRLVLSNTSGFLWMMMLVGVGFIAKQKEKAWQLFLLVMSGVTLILNSALNVFSGPPSAAPGRYALFYMIVGSIYGAYGVRALIRYGRKRPFLFASSLLPLLAVVVYVYTIWWGYSRISSYPPGMPVDAIETGQAIKTLLSQPEILPEETYMIEVLFWEFLAVNLSAEHFDRVVYDRELDSRKRDLPSLFWENEADILKVLNEENVRFIALHDPEIQIRVDALSFIDRVQKIGGWSIYEYQHD